MLLKKPRFDYICDVPHRIKEKVYGTIYVEVPLNQVDAF